MPENSRESQEGQNEALVINNITGKADLSELERRCREEGWSRDRLAAEFRSATGMRLHIRGNTVRGISDPLYEIEEHGRVHKIRPHKPFRPEGSRGHIRTRGKITKLSRQSWGRMVCKMSRLTATGFATLTYPRYWREAAGSPQESKAALNAFHRELRRHWPCTGGIWVLEFQARGAPHYHLWTTGEEPEDWQAASDWVRDAWMRRGGGKISNWEPVRYPDAAARYAAKESAGKGKAYQKDSPPNWNPGRFWGEFGEPGLSPVIEGQITGSKLAELGAATNDKTGRPYVTNWGINSTS